MAGLLDAFAQYIRDAMPGGALNSEWTAQNIKRMDSEINRGLLESTGINARDKRRAWNKGLLDAVSGSDDTMSSINQQAFDSVMNLASIAPMGITAWHGSPHKFDKFSLSNVGTGEGAQAYGHGLYFAEKPETATMYQNLAGRNFKANPNIYDRAVEILGEDANSPHGRLLAESIATKPNSMILDVDQIKSKIHENIRAKNRANELEALILGDSRQKLSDSDASAAIKLLEKFADSWDVKAGSLYKVDIPDEAVSRMLDWDKPLSQQSPEVQKAVGANILFPDSMTGEEVYKAIASESVKKQGAGADHNAYASKFFSESLGLPGIRYLDQGSRGAGGGTSNYVLFSDQLPRIIERNGIETGAKPWAPGEWESFNQGLQK